MEIYQEKSSPKSQAKKLSEKGSPCFKLISFLIAMATKVGKCFDGTPSLLFLMVLATINESELMADLNRGCLFVIPTELPRGSDEKSDEYV